MKESLEKNNEKLNLEIGTRVACVITEAIDVKDALTTSHSLFEEALDVMSLETNGVASASLMKSGIIRNLADGKIKAIIKDPEFSPSNIFRIQEDRYPSITHKEYILLNKNNIELCDRFLKSLHWSRHANWEKNLQMRILFNWFSIEALFKIDENDNIAPKAMLAMGFPLGLKKNEISVSLRTKLETHSDYENWRKIITQDMENIRIFRNDSVHSGFRFWDISDHKIKKYSYLSKIACSSCQRLGEYAISSGCKTATELWRDAPKLLDKVENLINFVHGTLIYSLDKKTYEWY